MLYECVMWSPNADQLHTENCEPNTAASSCAVSAFADKRPHIACYCMYEDALTTNEC